jgi:hypothetical protein
MYFVSSQKSGHPLAWNLSHCVVVSVSAGQQGVSGHVQAVSCGVSAGGRGGVKATAERGCGMQLACVCQAAASPHHQSRRLPRAGLLEEGMPPWLCRRTCKLVQPLLRAVLAAAPFGGGL